MALDVDETRRRECARRTAARLAESAAYQDHSCHHRYERQQKQSERPSQLLREIEVAVKALRVMEWIHGESPDTNRGWLSILPPASGLGNWTLVP
jgi:hypothetical protein